ncbi:MAG TPA: peptidoglycan-associated lipoprotein Pal [Xanthomonadaceae bacterium]|nr:peptidoglycan-associated lipoprotein Pal [Xanthomonadaceae bacterium]
MNISLRVILAAALCVTLAACKTTKTPPADEPEPVRPEPIVQPVRPSDVYDWGDLETDSCLRQRVVYFDFDQSVIRPEFARIIACHAKFLRDVPAAQVTLEGHCDERGSREYNLGLGERRGNAVGSALRAQGGGGGQLNVVSYGEERPVCTQSNEDCWQRNRRVEIIYTR